MRTVLPHSPLHGAVTHDRFRENARESMTSLHCEQA